MIRTPGPGGHTSAAGRAGRGAATAAALLVCLSVGACSTDIFDVSVQLGAQSFQVDFGAATGTIPTVACNAQTTSMCGAPSSVGLAGDGGELNVTPGCDGAAGRCYVQATAVARYTVDVLMDDGFTTKVAQKSVSAVRMLDLAYTIPVNSTTFEIPVMDVYVGPPGSRTPADPGVHHLDSISALPPGTTFADVPRHLVVADGSPARTLIEKSIKAKSPFVFILSMMPRLESGSPVPAGMMSVKIQPFLGLGLR